MYSVWTVRRAWLPSACAFLSITIAPAFAQKGGSTGGTSGGGATGSGAGSAGVPNGSNTTNYPGSTNFPGSTNPSSPGVWQPSRPIFLSGRVLFDDGASPNSDIRVERVCNGTARLEAHTDRKGQFSFQVGQNGSVDTDASDPASGGYGRSGGGFGNSGVGGFGSGANTGPNNLWGCELRASYPGYRSDVVELGSHRSSDDPNVGTIILHRLGGSSAGTISLTTALVPKHAQKDYEKGVQLAEKGKFEEAEKRFQDATATYPKYAIAWFALGQVQQREGNAESARKSYDAAIAADAKYASPYDQLALLSAQAQQWESAAKYSQQVIALDSVDYPSSLWYNAIANYHLNKPEEVQKSLRELLRLDTTHHYPEAESMYAQVLLYQGNNAEAATHLRAYLAIAPNAKGAAAAKEMLTKLDQAKSAPEK